MKPGITCLWQISGRNEVSFQEWMKLDLTYIDNWSLLLDLKILLKTVPVVLTRKGSPLNVIHSNGVLNRHILLMVCKSGRPFPLMEIGRNVSSGHFVIGPAGHQESPF